MYFLVIDKDQTIEGLKQQFRKHFPYLKLEFFREPCVKGKGFSKDKMIPPGEPLTQLLKMKRPQKHFFDGETIVSDLEHAFYEKFGICTQVFRKSGNIWLETTSTDDWTLNQQNEEGKSLAKHFNIERENPDDHDIY